MSEHLKKTAPHPLRALLKAATPGPWSVYRCTSVTYGEDGACGLRGPGYTQEYGADIVQDCSRDECHHPMDDADASLIVALRNGAEELLDQLDESEELATTVASLIEGNACVCGCRDDEHETVGGPDDALLKTSKARLCFCMECKHQAAHGPCDRCWCGNRPRPKPAPTGEAGGEG